MNRKQSNLSQAKAKLRAQLIMKVRCGLMTASDAADQLKVSRKTYYKWEQRGLSALLKSLSDQLSGRPEKTGQVTEAALGKQLADLKRDNKLLEQKLVLKDLVADFQIRSPKGRKKKK